MPFGESDLQLIADTREVRIETRAGDRSYRTIIWVVVDNGEVFVRSVRGENAKWYQRALKNPEVALQAALRRIEARAIPATDPDSVERTSEALRRKYGKGRSLDSMVAPDVLETTLRLDPP